GSTTLSILAMCVAAALLGPYAQPPGAALLNPPMLLVTTTWLLTPPTPRPFLLPASSNLRNAMVVNHTLVLFTANVFVKSSTRTSICASRLPNQTTNQQTGKTRFVSQAKGMKIGIVEGNKKNKIQKTK